MAQNVILMFTVAARITQKKCLSSQLSKTDLAVIGLSPIDISKFSDRTHLEYNFHILHKLQAKKKTKHKKQKLHSSYCDAILNLRRCYLDSDRKVPVHRLDTAPF